MIVEDFENLMNKLAQFLEIENALLKESNKNKVIQGLDEKTHLFLEFYKSVNFYHSHPEVLEKIDHEKKQNFKLKVAYILELAQQNEMLLKKINQISERILQKIIHKVRKINEPLESYTVLGEKKSTQKRVVTQTLYPISFNHQI